MDERQILLEAKELITQQRYEAARRLLRPIAHHPTAHKWLDTLDKIAPPPPPERIWQDDPLELTDTDEASIGDPFAEPPLDTTPLMLGGVVMPPPLNYDHLTDAEKFELVKRRIKSKDYEQARAILLTAGDDPAAQTLLAKLDQKRPTIAPPPTSSPRPLTKKPLPFSKPAHFPFGKPINPTLIGVMLFTFTVAAMPMLCINWKRFGKPKWVAPSFLLGGFLMLALVAVLIFPIGDSTALKFGPVLMLAVAFHVYLFAMYYMQIKAYEPVRKSGDVAGMLNYRYQWGPTVFGAGALILIGVAVGMVLSGESDTPSTPITSDYLTLERPPDWYAAPAEEGQFCHDYEQGCFLYLRHQDMTDVGMTFAYFPLNGVAPDVMVTYLWQQYMAWYPNLPFGPRTTLTVDATTVVFQLYSFPNRLAMDTRQAFDYSVARGYVVTEGGLIQITYWSAEAEQFQATYDDFETIIGSIELKGGA